jgi:hypothetical protein
VLFDDRRILDVRCVNEGRLSQAEAVSGCLRSLWTLEGQSYDVPAQTGGELSVKGCATLPALTARTYKVHTPKAFVPAVLPSKQDTDCLGKCPSRTRLPVCPLRSHAMRWPCQFMQLLIPLACRSPLLIRHGTAASLVHLPSHLPPASLEKATSAW